MSWPLVITTVTYSFVGITDLYVAGTLGSASQAAVGLSEQILFVFTLFIMAAGTGTTALVSRYWGSGNVGRAQRFSAQSLTLAVAMGVILCVCANICAHFMVGFFSESPDVKSIGALYLGLYSLYMIPWSIVSISNCSFRAVGDAKTPLYVVGTMAMIQISGDFLTVIYNWPVPNLGVAGIAYSAMLAALVGAVISIVRIMRSPLAGSLKKLFPIVPTMVKRIVKIGIPSAFQRMAWTYSVFIVFFILARCPQPTEALAAWTVGMRVEALMFMPVMALSMAVAAIVGQNLGAKEIDRAYNAGWKVAWIGISMLAFVATIVFFMAETIAQNMSRDPGTIAIVSSYLKINALSEPCLALGMILSGALQGAGDTRTPMWITIFTNWVIRLPLAYWLAIVLKLGPAGVWWAMTLSVVTMGFLVAWRYRERAWTRIHI
jgi:putative efflux protein, MATE family